MHSCTGAPVFYSSYANKMKKMIDLISPFLFFVIVNAAVSSGMEALWTWYLQDRILAAAGPAYGWTVLHFWSLLSTAVPPGIGCLAVRRDLLRELYRFREDYENRKLEDVENGKTGRLSPDKEGRRFSLLLCSAVLLSLGLNSLISMIPGGSVSSLNGELAGPAQLVSAALVYGLMMPLIEESVFRGILFSCLEREYGFRTAALFSALLFGLYHGSWQQGLYAFIMGIIFACAYEETGRLQVPCFMHGLCNLAVLFLGWTKIYGLICTPGWAAALLAAAAGGFMTAHRIATDKP